MKLITQRMLIRDVLLRWNKQYEELYPGVKTFSERIGLSRPRTPQELAAELGALDLETASAEDVNKIIGNDSWTRLCCEECGESVTEVVEVGSENCADESICLCWGCARGATLMLSDAVSARLRRQLSENKGLLQ